MRVLVVCQHYWPEPFNTADVCEELVRRGHEVTVLTGLPNTGLPGNDVPREYARGKRRLETHKGVNVVRVGMAPRKSGAVNRVKNYLSFWVNASRKAASLDRGFDVVIGYQFSPVMQVDPAVRYCEKTGAPLLVYSFDLWPESLVAGGFSRESLAFRWIGKVSKRIYESADTLAVTSPLFEGYFAENLGMDGVRTVYLPQYAEAQFSEACEHAAPEGYDPEKIHFTFAGNVGAAQQVETIVKAAALVGEESGIVFHIVGSGALLDACKKAAGDLGADNVVFHGRQPFEAMPAYYAASDAMIVGLGGSSVLSYTLPRKVQSYMAAGRPLVAIAQGEVRRVVDDARCGYCSEPDDAQGFADMCLRMAGLAPCEREALGRRARRYYDEHFSREQFFDSLEYEMNKLAGTRHGEKCA